MFSSFPLDLYSITWRSFKFGQLTSSCRGCKCWAWLGLVRRDQRWELRDERAAWRAIAPCWRTSGRPCSWWPEAAGGGRRSWSSASDGCGRPEDFAAEAEWTSRSQESGIKIEVKVSTVMSVASIKNITTLYLRHRTDQRRYLWRASMEIYLALYNGIKRRRKFYNTSPCSINCSISTENSANSSL